MTDENYTSTYIEMGFSPDLARRAASMFGSDVQSASEYMLRQTTLGTMPKRFKNARSSEFVYTFYKSKLLLGDDTYVVSDYDARFNIIEIEPWHSDTSEIDARWISLSDPGITWRRESHGKKLTVAPVSMVPLHQLGRIYLPVKQAFAMTPANVTLYDSLLAEFDSQTENGLGHLTSKYTRRQVHSAANRQLGEHWRSLLSYTDKTNEQLQICPNVPQPRVITHRRQRHVRTKMWTKLKLILEIKGIDSAEADDLLQLGDIRTNICNLMTREGMDADTVTELLETYKNYSRPRDLLRKQKMEWNASCRAVFSIQNGRLVDNEYFTGTLVMSDRAFDSSCNPESKYWTHMQKIMNLVRWGRRLLTDTDMCLQEVNDISINGTAGQLVSLARWGEKVMEWCRKPYKHYIPSHTKWDPRAKNHQKQALDWMHRKEMASLTPRPPVGWTKKTLNSGFYFYIHEFGNVATSGDLTPYDGLSPDVGYDGGVLTMPSGMGKTFTVLKLIERMKNTEEWRKDETIDATLIIVSPAALDTWKTEIATWTNLTVNVFHGNGRSLDVSKDIVLSTYRVVCSEHAFDAPLGNTSFRQIRWRRIVIDDGHNIRKMDGKLYRAVTQLKLRDHATKWILTATPVVDSFMDITTYFNFLAVYPWSRPGLGFRTSDSISWAVTSYSEYYPQLAIAFRTVAQSMLFNQTKSMVIKTNKTVKRQINWDIAVTEPTAMHLEIIQLLYEMVKLRAAGHLSTGQKSKLVAWLRRVAVSAHLVPTSMYGVPVKRQHDHSISSVAMTVDNLEFDSSVAEKFQETLRQSLVNTDDSKCPICLDVVDCPTVTACGHLFCSECIHSALSHQGRYTKKCPCCRSHLQNSILYEIKKTQTVTDSGDKVFIQDRLHGSSEVLKTTVEKLRALEAEESCKSTAIKTWLGDHVGEKVIILTEFKECVALIKKAVEQVGQQCVAVISPMTSKQREVAVRTFNTDRDCRVFVGSTKSTPPGMSLIAASTIIFYEPCINKNVLQKNLSKIDRIGQTSDQLNVLTLATAKSVEEDMLKTRKNTLTLKDVGIKLS